jgi:hypothetical protein
MKAKGLNPFKDQPRRTDLHYTEAVGHFHLYAWLQAAIGRRCVTSPEFPTGNGKVDIHIRCNGKKGIIEVKSFVDMSETRKGTEQAAAYARSLNLNSVTLALFVPVDDETVLTKLSGEQQLWLSGGHKNTYTIEVPYAQKSLFFIETIGNRESDLLGSMPSIRCGFS